MKEKKYLLLAFCILGFSQISLAAPPSIKSGTGTGSVIIADAPNSNGQDNEASGDYSSAIGVANKATGERSSAFGYWNDATGERSSAFGYGNEAAGRESSAFGLMNRATGGGSSAFGTGNEATGDYSSAFGYWNTAAGGGSSAFGYGNTAAGEKSSIFGSLYGVTGDGSGAWGVGEWDSSLNGGNGDHVYKNEGTQSYMLGNRNQIAAGTEHNFILGNDVSIGAGISHAVVLGDGSEVGESNTVSVGSAAQKRKIVNVADGVDDSDAATFGQLKSYVAAHGGGAPVDAYTKAESDNKFAGKDASNLSATDVAAWKTKLGVGAGGGVDAYTKEESDMRFANKEELRKTKKELRGIGSLSAALAGLHPMQYDKNAPSQVMAALGNYRDKQAIAVGVSHYFSPNAMMSAGVALSNEKRTNAMANVGFTLKLGKGGSQVPMENASVVQSEVRRLTVENQELKSQVNAQGIENKELKAQVQSQEHKINTQNQRIQKLEEALNTLLKK